MGVNKTLLTPSVVDAVVKKINQKRITNSKDIRRLRIILRDPVAKAHFLTEEGDIDSAMLQIAHDGPKQQPPGLINELDAAINAIKNTPWTTVEELRGDPSVLKKLEETQGLLQSLQRNLTTT